MAFESEARLVNCSICSEPNKYFKMWNNPRVQDKKETSMNLDEETGQMPKTGRMAVRICCVCELSKRVQEMEAWTDEKKSTVGEDYAALTRVQKDMKRVNKGTD